MRARYKTANIIYLSHRAAPAHRERHNYIRASTMQSRADSRNSLIASTPAQIERLKSIFYSIYSMWARVQNRVLFADSERCVYANSTHMYWDFSIN